MYEFLSLDLVLHVRVGVSLAHVMLLKLIDGFYNRVPYLHVEIYACINASGDG